MAAMLDVSPSAISSWEAGDRTPSTEKVEMMEKLLRIRLLMR